MVSCRIDRGGLVGAARRTHLFVQNNHYSYRAANFLVDALFIRLNLGSGPSVVTPVAAQFSEQDAESHDPVTRERILAQPALATLDSLQKQLDELRNKLIGIQKAEGADVGKLGQLAQEIALSRQRRAAVFQSNDLFGEPAWDILLGLYVADDAQQKLSVTEVCGVAGLPLTTGLRWIERLEKEGWVCRTPDPVDRRRFWVLLTDRAQDVMRDYLAGISLRPSQG